MVVVICGYEYGSEFDVNLCIECIVINYDENNFCVVLCGWVCFILVFEINIWLLFECFFELVGKFCVVG